MSTAHVLQQRFTSKTALVAIIGLNREWMQIARSLSSVGFRVFGIDLTSLQDPNRGFPWNEGFPRRDVPGIPACTVEQVNEPWRLSEADVLIVCIQAGLTSANTPDLGPLTQSAHLIAKQLRTGQLVIVAGPGYPGVTRDLISELRVSGLVAGRDYFVGCCPVILEPITVSGSPYPFVVGGLDVLSTELAHALFSYVNTSACMSSSLETAEACFIIAEICQTVSHALANELKLTLERMGGNLWEVISRCGALPGVERINPGQSGCSVGALSFAWAARKFGFSSRVLEASCRVQELIPTTVLGKVVDALNDVGKAIRGSRIVILGMEYEKSGASSELLRQLLRKGAVVRCHHPSNHVPTGASPPLQMNITTLTHELLAELDAVLILADDLAYDWKWIASHAVLIIDTQNATRHVSDSRSKIVIA